MQRHLLGLIVCLAVVVFSPFAWAQRDASAGYLNGEGERTAAQTTDMNSENGPVHAINVNEEQALTLLDLQRSLRRRGIRQNVSVVGVLAGGAALSVPMFVAGFPEGNCEANKRVCGTLHVGDFSSIADDFAAGVSFAGISAAVAGSAMLISAGVHNLRLAADDYRSIEEFHEARARMLTRFGRRTKTAGAAVMIAGAAAAITGGILYAVNVDDCELRDCAVVPGATKAIVVGAFVGAITGGMMMGVGARAQRRAERLQPTPDLQLALSPWFSRHAGGGAMTLVW